jgi:hypothetical protein
MKYKEKEGLINSIVKIELNKKKNLFYFNII